jgi:hypothetical protein
VILVVEQSNNPELGVIDAIGKVVLELMLVVAVALQPLLAVTITEYVPADETTLVAAVVPSFQRYVPPPVAVSVILVFEQSNTPELGVMDAMGKLVLEVIVVLADDVQPLLAVTTTEYVPADETTLVEAVVPSFQRYVPPPEAVSVTLLVLQSNTALIGVMLAVGGVVFDVIKAVAVAVQPLLPVTVTE